MGSVFFDRAGEWAGFADRVVDEAEMTGLMFDLDTGDFYRRRFMSLRRYKCYKEVNAGQIEGYVKSGKMETTLFLEGGKEVKVNEAWMKRCFPINGADFVGGYYVVYKDGYTSFSPQKAFEEGYEVLSASETGLMDGKYRTQEETIK